MESSSEDLHFDDPKIHTGILIDRKCTMGVYPFMFGNVKDFEPVVEEIIRASTAHFISTIDSYSNIYLQKGLREPYDWDEYAESFIPKAQELSEIAEEAAGQGENDKASEYFL